MIAIVAPDSAYGLSKILVKLLKDAIELRKKATELIGKGLTVNIQISNSFNFGSKVNGNGVLIDQNTGTIVINDPKILWAAQLTRRPIDEILKKIDGSDVEFVDFSSASDELQLNSEDKQISGSYKEELDKNLSIVGRLDLVAFSHHTGL